EFLRFARHWDFRPRACRPYRAQTKGKVERPVRDVRGNFVYGRIFVHDADLDQQRRHWLEHVANVRVHGTTGERPRGRFDRDGGLLLQPWARRPYTSLVLDEPARPPGHSARPARWWRWRNGPSRCTPSSREVSHEDRHALAARSA